MCSLKLHTHITYKIGNLRSFSDPFINYVPYTLNVTVEYRKEIIVKPFYLFRTAVAANFQ